MRKINWIFFAFLLLHTACAGCHKHRVESRRHNFGLGLTFTSVQALGSINGRPVIELRAQIGEDNVPNESTFIGAIFVPKVGGQQDKEQLRKAIQAVEEEGRSLGSKGQGIKPNTIHLLKGGTILWYENLKHKVAQGTQKKDLKFAVSFIQQNGLQPKTEYQIYMFAVCPDSEHPWVFSTQDPCSYTTPDFIASVPVAVSFVDCEGAIIGANFKVRFKFKGTMGPPSPTVGQACFLLVKEDAGGPTKTLAQLLETRQPLPAHTGDPDKNFQLVASTNRDVIVYPLSSLPTAPAVDHLDMEGVVPKNTRYEVYLVHRDGEHFSVSQETMLTKMLEVKATPSMNNLVVAASDFNRNTIDPVLTALTLRFDLAVSDQKNTNDPKLCAVFWESTVTPTDEELIEAIGKANASLVDQFQPQISSSGKRFAICLASNPIAANEKAAIAIPTSNINALSLTPPFFERGKTYQARAAFVDANFKGAIILDNGATQTVSIPDLKATLSLDSLALDNLIVRAAHGFLPTIEVFEISFQASVSSSENTMNPKLALVLHHDQNLLSETNIRAAIGAANRDPIYFNQFQTVLTDFIVRLINDGTDLTTANTVTCNNVDACAAGLDLGYTYHACVALIDNDFQGACLLNDTLTIQELKLPSAELGISSAVGSTNLQAFRLTVDAYIDGAENLDAPRAGLLLVPDGTTDADVARAFQNILVNGAVNNFYQIAGTDILCASPRAYNPADNLYTIQEGPYTLFRATHIYNLCFWLKSKKAIFYYYNAYYNQFTPPMLPELSNWIEVPYSINSRHYELREGPLTWEIRRREPGGAATPLRKPTDLLEIREVLNQVYTGPDQAQRIDDFINHMAHTPQLRRANSR